MSSLKKCRACGTVKSLSQFDKAGAHHRKVCKSCLARKDVLFLIDRETLEVLAYLGDCPNWWATVERIKTPVKFPTVSYIRIQGTTVLSEVKVYAL